MLWDCDGHDSWVSCRAVECIVSTHVMIFEKIPTRHLSQTGSRGTWMTITAVTESSHLYPYKRWNTTISQGERPIFSPYGNLFVVFDTFDISRSQASKERCRCGKLFDERLLSKTSGNMEKRFVVTRSITWSANEARGYILVSARSSCKAIKGKMKLMYVTFQRYTNIEHSQAVWESQNTQCIRHQSILQQVSANKLLEWIDYALHCYTSYKITHFAHERLSP